MELSRDLIPSLKRIIREASTTGMDFRINIQLKVDQRK